MDLTILGLWIIAFAWIIQLAFSWKGNWKIRSEFVIAYLAGVALLLVDEYTKSAGVSYYQGLTFTAGLLLLIRMITVKNKK
jgi:hypothetical protein